MDARYQVLSGGGDFFIYDYKMFDAVKKDGKFFTSIQREEADQFLKTLTQEHLHHEINEKGTPVNIWK